MLLSGQLWRRGEAVSVECVAARVVVVTTEAQWMGAVLRLAEEEPKNESWPQTANQIQRVFCAGLRQPLDAQSRGLAPHELVWLRQGRGSVFLHLWGWLGPVCASLRHSRLLSHLWRQGLLAGLLGRHSSESLLLGRPDGCFVLRFSERAAPTLVAAYVREGLVRQYLLRLGDVAPPQRSLADWVSQQHHLTHILQCQPGVIHTIFI